MQVREAYVEDADEACGVIRRSIAELCHADHKGDASTLAPVACQQDGGKYAPMD